MCFGVSFCCNIHVVCSSSSWLECTLDSCASLASAREGLLGLTSQGEASAAFRVLYLLLGVLLLPSWGPAEHSLLGPCPLDSCCCALNQSCEYYPFPPRLP